LLHFEEHYKPADYFHNFSPFGFFAGPNSLPAYPHQRALPKKVLTTACTLKQKDLASGAWPCVLGQAAVGQRRGEKTVDGSVIFSRPRTLVVSGDENFRNA
jgi:hypothetical protein